jgi:hypothetical protein
MEKTKPIQIAKEKPKYEPPKVITLSKEKILAELGPARACTSWYGGIAGFCNDLYPPLE